MSASGSRVTRTVLPKGQVKVRKGKRSRLSPRWSSAHRAPRDSIQRVLRAAGGRLEPCGGRPRNHLESSFACRRPGAGRPLTSRQHSLPPSDRGAQANNLCEGKILKLVRTEAKAAI